jgi:hypothetical protein
VLLEFRLTFWQGTDRSEPYERAFYQLGFLALPWLMCFILFPIGLYVFFYKVFMCFLYNFYIILILLICVCYSHDVRIENLIRFQI